MLDSMFRWFALSFVAFVAFASVAAADPVRAPESLAVPSGFSIEIIAHVRAARELAVASNGDLLVGTLGSDVFIVDDAERAVAAPRVFAHVDDSPAAGVALSPDALYIGGQFTIWRVPYKTGDRVAQAKPQPIAHVRPNGLARRHVTSTVAIARDRLFVSVGSSCDACDPEIDSTRAAIFETGLEGGPLKLRAAHIRNAIALATNPDTRAVWAGVAEQDMLEHGHPYEVFDPFTVHDGVPDYGWPHCYENQRAVDAKRDCRSMTVARAVFPAYMTPIGAAIYPLHQTGKYAFPAAFAGGAFVGLHGSWHVPLVPPRVAFMALDGDTPKVPVDWNDPHAQWSDFLTGFQRPDGSRLGRPTGVAIGPEGSLFIADDRAGVIYRIRPR